MTLNKNKMVRENRAAHPPEEPRCAGGAGNIDRCLDGGTRCGW